MKKIPYKSHLPSAARYLIDSGITKPPRQREISYQYAEGVDIVYTLRNLTPANFKNYSDTLLLLAYQESMRYNEYKWKFAKFEVKLGRLRKGRDLPDVQSYQSSMHDDPEIMIYGPGYEVPQRYFLYNKVEDILEISKRYEGKVSKQNPYRVIKLIISIRDPNR